ncbi:tyrosine-type recombinase/integrase [Saccharopolyspora sp. 5N102]|uniref:tyrosine-type recombinase/integrase n=1 Tax=Saccharopolyspora sp. 5N102 TaxID=3375155 RepID=UPI0037912E2C
MTSATSSGADRTEVEAARLVLERMGVSPHDLLGSTIQRPAAPTFADYIPQVAAAVSEGTRRVYSSYWNRIVDHWGHRRLDEPTSSEIKQLAEHVRTQVVRRRNARGGRSAAEHLIAAMRCVYNHAVDDKLIPEADNPARRVAKPRRLPSTRRALPESGLEEVNRVAASTGNDPALDTLLLRLHTETACRRGGALALRFQDLDPVQCLILLHEKGDTTRWQPVSPTLMRHLQNHADQRGAAVSGGQLLRYRDGRPITTRRYDHLWKRIGQHLPWVATQQISTHWLRHTTLKWVERRFGYAVARAYAGHTDSNSGDAGTTTTYIRADLDEVAAALAALTSEPHPLAPDAPMAQGVARDAGDDQSCSHRAGTPRRRSQQQHDERSRQLPGG